MMKKQYEKPMAEKIVFNYTETIVASGDDETSGTEKWQGWNDVCTNNNGNKEMGGWEGKKCKKS